VAYGGGSPQVEETSQRGGSAYSNWSATWQTKLRIKRLGVRIPPSAPSTKPVS